MRRPTPVPAHLAHRAFSRAEALDAGISPRMLQHKRFVEVHPSVYRLDGVELDDTQRIEAARLALPADARVSHGTRLWLLGLEIGALLPLHFTVARDLHLTVAGVMLHRTVKMPATDDAGVSIVAAFIGLASLVRPIELVEAGDWLLNHRLLRLDLLRWVAHRDAWRPGAKEALEIIDRLDGRSRSIKESELRVILWAAGLPVPEVNAEVRDDRGRFLGIGDLVFRDVRLVIEYEGRQHAFDVAQFNRDIERYEGFRRAGWTYLQVTAEMLARPRALVQRVHSIMVERGYQGPTPVFGERWDAVFAQPARLRHRRSVDPQLHSA